MRFDASGCIICNNSLLSDIRMTTDAWALSND